MRTLLWVACTRTAEDTLWRFRFCTLPCNWITSGTSRTLYWHSFIESSRALRRHSRPPTRPSNLMTRIATVITSVRVRSHASDESRKPCHRWKKLSSFGRNGQNGWHLKRISNHSQTFPHSKSCSHHRKNLSHRFHRLS